jgi:hypothetical protein
MAERKTKKTAKPVVKSRRPIRAGKKSRQSEKMEASLKSSVPKLVLPKKAWTVIIAALVAIVIIVAGYFLYTRVYASPSRVFWAMVNNNLSTRGVTRETNQPTCLPVNAQMTNTIQYTFTPSLSVRCLTHISNGSANLTIESIGNVSADYERYSKVDTPGKAKDYSKIYGLWLKDNGSEANGPRLYGQLLNGPVLFGYLNGPEKTRLSNDLRSVYGVDYSKMQRQTSKGRVIYTYPVTISLRKYAEAERSYADSLGLPMTNRINPANYTANAKVKLDFSVDVFSRQLRGIGLNGGNEVYSSYGVQGDISLPAKTVSDQVLQNAFQQATK